MTKSDFNVGFPDFNTNESRRYTDKIKEATEHFLCKEIHLDFIKIIFKTHIATHSIPVLKVETISSYQVTQTSLHY